MKRLLSVTVCLSGGIVAVIDSFPECANYKLATGGLAEPLPTTQPYNPLTLP